MGRSLLGRWGIFVSIAVVCGCGGQTDVATGRGTGSDAAVSDAGAGREAGATATATDAASADTANEASTETDAGPVCATDDVYFVVATGSRYGVVELEAFHPSSGDVTDVGTVDCTSLSGEPINGLAVDRAGHFFVAIGWDDVRPLVAQGAGYACAAAGFEKQYDAQGLGFLQPIGIAMSARPGGDALYASFFDLYWPGAPVGPTPTGRALLSTLDLQTGAATVVSTGSPGESSMAGTWDGRLFAAFDGETISEIDPSSGTLLRSWDLQPALLGLGLGLVVEPPFVSWAADFFVFPTALSTTPSTDIVRFHEDDGSATVVATFVGSVLAAAVSTCAPLP